jgi:hypothetical protein
MARVKKFRDDTTANLGFEAKLWAYRTPTAPSRPLHTAQRNGRLLS